MNRKLFVELAGGVYRNHKSYHRWGGRDKRDNFWDFFDGEAGARVTIYGGLEVRDLYDTQNRTIEHILPRNLLRDRILGRSRPECYGATTNPLNFAASHKKLNNARGNVRFDLDDDPIVKIVPCRSPNKECWEAGFDAQQEWVVPLPSRGDVARAVLYMALVYRLRIFSKKDVKTLVKWARQDLPDYWEIHFSDWVYRRLGIWNPFCARPFHCEALTWLKEPSWLNVLLYRKRRRRRRNRKNKKRSRRDRH